MEEACVPASSRHCGMERSGTNLPFPINWCMDFVANENSTTNKRRRKAMDVIGTIIIIIGVIVMIVGGIMLLIVAFKESIWWGLGSIFVPFVAIVFLIMHWQKAKKSFFIWLAGCAVYIVGMVLGGSLG